MPSGDWCKGKTAATDERVKRMGRAVSGALRDLTLRKYLDDQKRLSESELRQRIATASTRWTLASDDLSRYEKLSRKNFVATCDSGHEQTVSVSDVLDDVACKTCQPRRNAGKHNPAYVDTDEFKRRLSVKHGENRFLFDESEYAGVTKPIAFACTACDSKFKTQPKTVLETKHGCPECARRHVATSQTRTPEQFFRTVKERHGDRFEIHPKPDQKYGNDDLISRTCAQCNTMRLQRAISVIIGRCSVCSKMEKKSTASFIETSKRIWGEREFDYSLVDYVNNKTHVVLRCKHGHAFKVTPSNHIALRRGCPDCSAKRFVSIGETEWLDSLAIPKENRNAWITVGDEKYNADALINGTVYEYYGDYWHGNPNTQDPEKINVYTNKTLREHHEHTLERENALKKAGYVVITMWESDWRRIKGSKDGRRPLDSATI